MAKFLLYLTFISHRLLPYMLLVLLLSYIVYLKHNRNCSFFFPPTPGVSCAVILMPELAHLIINWINTQYFVMSGPMYQTYPWIHEVNYYSNRCMHMCSNWQMVCTAKIILHALIKISVTLLWIIFGFNKLPRYTCQTFVFLLIVQCR